MTEERAPAAAEHQAEEEGSVGWTVLYIAEDVARWVMWKVAIGAALLAALGGLLSEAPNALRFAATISAGLALGLAVSLAVRQQPATRARSWLHLLLVLVVCGGLAGAVMTSDP